MEDFFKWIDEGSHGVEEDLYAEDPQQRNKRYIEMFHQLFKKLGHEAHYEMMMRDPAENRREVHGEEIRRGDVTTA